MIERLSVEEADWGEAYTVLLNAYRDLQPDFSIEYDSFDGYRLIYRVKMFVRTPTVFRGLPASFVRAVPDESVTDLSVMSSERTGEQLILLGPVRFVNSDCNPNCVYDFSSDSGIVQLRVKKPIKPGDEIFVRYGEDYFEVNSCRCRTCALSQKDTIQNNIRSDPWLEDLLREIASQTLQNERNLVEAVITSKQRKRRIRGLELVEFLACHHPLAKE